MRRDPLFVLLAVLAGLTSLALGVSGETTMVALFVPAAAILVIVRPIEGPRGRYYEAAFNVVAGVALCWFLFSASQGRLLAGAVAATVPAHLHALCQRPSRDTLRRLQLMSFFQLVALAAATTAILFGPLLLVHLVLLPITLTLGALERAESEPPRRRLGFLRRLVLVLTSFKSLFGKKDAPEERPRRPARWSAGFLRSSLLASAVVLLGGALAFVILPRYEAGFLAQFSQPSQRLSGFSETVSFGDITRIQTSSRLVMRVRLSGDVPRDVRFRGIALDRFSGRDWTVTSPHPTKTFIAETINLAPSIPHSKRFVQEFSLERLSPTALFAAPRAVRIAPKDFPGVKQDAWGNIARTFGVARRLSYEIVSELGKDESSLPDDLREASLQLPELDERVRTLAREAAGEGSDAVRAAAIERWLQEHCTYTLDVNDVGVTDPIGTFLLDRRRGHCEYFASAMVVLLRVDGIPARLVDGFQAGERSRFFGYQLVRQRDAHSWVEAWIEGRGWTTFDPTPADDSAASAAGGVTSLWSDLEMLWDDNVIGFNYTFQVGYVDVLRDLLSGVTGWFSGSGGMLSLAAAGAAIALLVAAWRRQRARARALVRAPRWYVAALRLMARRMQARHPAQTPAEYAHAFAATWPGEPGDAALELTRLYHEARLGGRAVDETRVDELIRVLQLMPRRRRMPGRAPSAASS